MLDAATAFFQLSLFNL